jgi:hypothetical protein
MHTSCVKCLRRFSIRPEWIGKKGKCPACGKVQVIYQESPLRAADPVQPARMPEVVSSHRVEGTRPLEARLPEPFFDFDPAEADHESGALEPWYYGFLERWANIVKWIAILLCVLLAAAVTAGAFWRAANEKTSLYLLALPFVWLALALELVSVLIRVALILLAVDAGRKLRSINRRLR